MRPVEGHAMRRLHPIVLLLAFARPAGAQTDYPKPGMLQPGAARIAVAATAGSVAVPVTRAAGTDGAVGCRYATVDGTAVAGVDYVAASGTLAWADGDGAAKDVTVAILNDGVANGDKTFYVRLTAPTGGAGLGVAPASPPVNHEGRALGTMPALAAPALWNTAEADAVLAALQLMPANSPWNEDVSGLPVASNAVAMIGLIGAGTRLALNRDMNFTLVPAGQAKKAVSLFAYADESDPGPYPVPDNTPIENWPVDDGRTLAEVQQDINPPQGGDRHGLVLDPYNGFLYEFYQAKRDAAFAWSASNEATFNLRSNVLRPAGTPFGTDQGWTSSDAAGLPVLPAIPRYDECERGMVEHALRFTVQVTRKQYVYPATHYASSNTDPNRPRMGERFRLKKTAAIDAAIAGMSLHPRAIAKALQKYGMFVADNGGNWRISAGSDPRLQNLSELTAFVGGDFEAVAGTGPDEGPRAASLAAVTITDGGGGGGGDTVPPSIAIASPTTATSYSTTAASLALGGTASDDVGVVQVRWTNSAGGSGTAAGTAAWSASIPLAPGLNTITVTAADAGGNVATDVLQVDRQDPGAPPPAGGGGGHGGGCGILGVEPILIALMLRRLNRSRRTESRS
jgi:hypothetical protein